MGMFDSVMVPCPKCGKPVEFQSKEGACDMSVYSIESAPIPILYDIINWPVYCEACGQWFALIDPKHPPGRRPRPSLSAVKVRTPGNPDTHFQGMKWWPDQDGFSYQDIDEEDRPLSGECPENERQFT